MTKKYEELCIRYGKNNVDKVISDIRKDSVYTDENFKSIMFAQNNINDMNNLPFLIKKYDYINRDFMYTEYLSTISLNILIQNYVENKYI